MPLETLATVCTAAPSLPQPTTHQGLSAFMLGAVCPMAAARRLALLAPEPPAPYSDSHRVTVLSTGLLEGQWKDPPCPWLFRPLSPWLTPAEGNMTQCPRSVLFPGRSQGQDRESGTCWVAGAKKPRQQAQLCHLFTVTLGRSLPVLGLLVHPALGRDDGQSFGRPHRGCWSSRWGTHSMEQYMGKQASEANPLALPP